MVQANREAFPRFKPREHNFTTFRARSLNAFARGRTDGLLARLATAQRLQLEEGLTTLKQSYPIPVPIGGFRPAQHPRVYDRPSEREITGGTLPWQAGMTEELKKLMRPGPVTTLYAMPNRAEQWGASGAALVDKLIVARLLDGNTGTHGYDNVAFFDTGKKIAPDDADSPTYDNDVTITFDPADPVPFIREAKRKLKLIPHPMSTGDAPQWIDQQLSAFLVSTNNFELFNDIANDVDRVVPVLNGANVVAAVARTNQERGTFAVIESKTMTDDVVFSIAAGPGAEACVMVHSLVGVESLPGGDFVSPDVWFEETGTWMQPRIWELDKNSEFAKLNGQILVGADLDVDAILYAPWSIQRITLGAP